jgi:hypothetical protein
MTLAKQIEPPMVLIGVDLPGRETTGEDPFRVIFPPPVALPPPR